MRRHISARAPSRTGNQTGASSARKTTAPEEIGKNLHRRPCRPVARPDHVAAPHMIVPFSLQADWEAQGTRGTANEPGPSPCSRVRRRASLGTAGLAQETHGHLEPQKTQRPRAIEPNAKAPVVKEYEVDVETPKKSAAARGGGRGTHF